jgi:hypothetical protein
VNELGPLPIADRNAELQRRSIRAFNSILPTDRFLYRDERADDAGVDGSLELLIDGHYTNLRSQVQLKGTDSSEVNNDGTISITVTAANLNYLLNGASPIYILYVEPRNELRFAWARDERRRLDSINPHWPLQNTVTIRFEHVLTPQDLEHIRERIRQEAQLQRRIHEVLARSSIGEQVITSIDTTTLSNSDPDELYQLLLASGLTIVSAGHAEQARRLIGLLRAADARAPKIKLVLAYADYATGRYQFSAAQLSEVELVRSELDEESQQILTYLKDANAYQTGQIDVDEYRQRLDDQSHTLPPGFRASYAISRLRIALFGQTDKEGRLRILDEMKSAVANVITDENIAAGFKTHVRLMLLESEGHEAVLSSLDEMHDAHMRRVLQQRIDLASLVQKQHDRWYAWEEKAKKLREEASDLNAPLLLADAIAIQCDMHIKQLLHSRIQRLIFDIPFEMPEDLLVALTRQIQEAIKIYSNADHTEGEMRLTLAFADLLEVSGRGSDARRIAEEVLPKATVLNYAALQERAAAHLSGKTILKYFTSAVEDARSKDLDFEIAAQDDSELKKYAKDYSTRLGLSDEQLANVERDSLAIRDIARERLNWCKHIDFTQNAGPTQQKDTYYRVEPQRRCVCRLHKYESVLEHTDGPVVISAFKRAYCDHCSDRSPNTVSETNHTNAV